MSESMQRLFPACLGVLRDRLAPIHYRELTRLALSSLGAPMSNKAAEDVREKLLERRSMGAFYSGPPLFAGAISDWFSTNRNMFAESLGVKVPRPPVEVSVEGMFHGLMRSPHMLTKTGATVERVMQARARGLQFESWVRHYFSCRWPAAVLPPDNWEVWPRPCNHDFKLRLLGWTYEVDVCGPSSTGQFRPVQSKPTADLHILCASDGTDLWMVSMARGREFHAFREHWTTLPIDRLIVALNCERDGMDYHHLRKLSARAN